MDILIHSLSGIAVSTVFIPFFNRKGIKKTGLLAAGAFGGAFPDIDAISLWSHFDGIFGKLLNLSHTGRDIYFSKLWYSHHGFFHSFGGILLSGIVIALLFHLILFIRKKTWPDKSLLFTTIIYVSVFFAGASTHLFEDMVTPSGPWGGVRLFWPSKVYFGGMGLIWWWNNYDIFLVVTGIIFLNSITIILKLSATKISKYLPILIFSIGIAVALNQIGTRKYHYNYFGFTTNYKELETKSKQDQQEIFSVPVYNFMSDLDQLIPFNF
jgi:inner membrane protein